jgi:hypothetical protein
MIIVIKCINNQFPNRPDNICSSIVGRTSSWYRDKLKRTDIEFIEKNTIEHYDWLNENKIDKFPSLLFYKDGELKYSRAHIMAQAQIMEVIENL